MSGGGGAALTVVGGVTVTSVDQITFTNGTATDDSNGDVSVVIDPFLFAHLNVVALTD